MIISVHATTSLSGTVILICIISGYLRPYQPALALADYKLYYICGITITALIVWASVPLPHGVTYADFELPDLFFQLHQPVDIPPIKLVPQSTLTLFHLEEACSPSLARQPLARVHGCGSPGLPGSSAERRHPYPKPSQCHRGPPRARSAFSVNHPCEGSARQGPSVNSPSFA